jgi:hypothetical protein
LSGLRNRATRATRLHSPLAKWGPHDRRIDGGRAPVLRLIRGRCRLSYLNLPILIPQLLRCHRLLLLFDGIGGLGLLLCRLFVNGLR